MPMTSFTHVHEVAAALERADASARVLGARARAARDGVDPAAAFSALASAGPEGLVPAVGTGGALAARHLEQAALAAAATGGALPTDVVEALAHAAGASRAQAGGANALDPAGAAQVVRREVAAVRGLAAHSMRRDETWEVMRLGTFLPRAAWMSALLLSCARVAASSPESADAVWLAAARVVGAQGDDLPVPGDVPLLLVTDSRAPISVAYSVEEVTSALFALSRQDAGDSALLALSRATAARLSNPSLRDLLTTDAVLAMSEVLNAIGALAMVGVPGAGSGPVHGRRRPDTVAGVLHHPPS
jgi:uncharacterized alpha-E superfamily protein